MKPATMYRDALVAIAAGGNAIQIAKEALAAGYVWIPGEVAAPARSLQVIVADAYGIDVIELLSARRSAAKPRHLAMWLCRESLGLSYTQLGKLFDRDHSSICFGVKNVSQDPRRYLWGVSSVPLHRLVMDVVNRKTGDTISRSARDMTNGKAKEMRAVSR
jgi:hypothetical protein